MPELTIRCPAALLFLIPGYSMLEVSIMRAKREDNEVGVMTSREPRTAHSVR